MAVVKQKEVVGRQVRTVQSNSPEGVRCEVSTPSPHMIITDEPAERGGTDTAASPLMHFTTSLATCQTVQIHKIAAAMRLKTGAINVEASTVTDRVAAVDGDAKVMRFIGAEMTIDIEVEGPDAKIEQLKKLSEDACPVGNIFVDAGLECTLNWNVLPVPE